MLSHFILDFLDNSIDLIDGIDGFFRVIPTLSKQRLQTNGRRRRQTYFIGNIKL